MEKLIFIIFALSILLCGCSNESKSIGIIGGADGPTSIIVSTGE